MTTTRYNLIEKYRKRLRIMKALNDLISALGTKPGPLTPHEKRRLTIAWRNLRRAAMDAHRIKQQLKDMP